MIYSERIYLKVIEFPGDIVDPSEYVEFVFVVAHGMPVPDCGEMSISIQFGVLAIGERELPKIIHSSLIILPAKYVNVAFICYCC